MHCSKITLFFLLFSLVFLPLSTVSLLAQNPAMGGGIGLSSVYTNSPKDNASNLRKSETRYFSQPRLSLNLEYNFPDRIKTKWLSKIYNPVFSNPYLQFRGQLMFNQFNISATKNGSIATIGGSLLFFPTKHKEGRNFNFFTEGGYKAAWNNIFPEPFHCVVIGIGGRIKMRNDWVMQPTLNYTAAFNDYLDLSGAKGFSLVKSDGFLGFHLSFLRTFMTSTDRIYHERAKDSLTMARTFAVSAAQKATQMASKAQALQSQFKPIADKAKSHEEIAKGMIKTANLISEKAVEAQKVQKTNRLTNEKVRELDSLQHVLTTLMIGRLLDLDKASKALIVEQEIKNQILDLKKDIQDAQQSLKLGYQYLPQKRELNSDVERINVQEGGEARRAILDSERIIKALEKDLEQTNLTIKTALETFEKAEKDLKNTSEQLEKVKKEPIGSRN